MRRKEIFLKKLILILGIILIISFVTGTEVPLPLRSESRLFERGGCFGVFENELIIKQDTNEIRITYLISGSYLYNRTLRDGVISLSEFKLFWDSLNSLGFWNLKGSYFVKSNFTGEIGGEISISFETEDSAKMTKTIQFSIPENCPPEFKNVYQLVRGMGDFAKTPSLDNLLKYYRAYKYWWYVEAEIGRIKDPKCLDTLKYILLNERKYAEGIIKAFVNIGNKKTVPTLCQFLEILDTTELEVYEQITDVIRCAAGYLPREEVIISAYDAIVSLEKGRSFRILKKYLSSKYSPAIRNEASIELARFHDYTGVPVMIKNMKEQKFSFHDFGFFATFCNKNKLVINPLVKELEVEARKKEPNDKIIAELIKGLSKITEQNFPYNPSDSLAGKKEIINKWLDWWEANKDTFK